MHAVMEYIDGHLGGRLDLATLASVAHFSPFHFHRLFQALVGESIGDHVRRRRLECGALRLRSHPSQSVLSVALSVGFGSAESFARAFRARYGLPPTEWRNSKIGQESSKTRQASGGAVGEHAAPSTQETPVNVVLIDREPVSVAYLRYTGAYGPGIGRFWSEKMLPWMATNDLLGRERFGIGLDDPGVTLPARCRYDACVASPEGEVLSGQPHRKGVPGGRYASLAFDGTGPQIASAWIALLRDWLPKSGLQLDERPMFEHFAAGENGLGSGRIRCNLCIPVAPL